MADAADVVRSLRREQPEPPADSEQGRVLAALRQVDPSVRSLSDYINGGTPPAALPLLARLLDEAEDSGVTESLVRALTVRGAGPDIARALLRAFTRPEQPEHVRWAAANALLEVRDAETAPEMVHLLRQPEFGTARQKLALALGFLPKTPGATEALTEVLPDRTVMAHAAMALKRRKAVEALPALRALDLTDATTWQRRQVEEAVKTLAALPQ